MLKVQYLLSIRWVVISTDTAARVFKLNCLQTFARFRVHILTCLIWWSLVLGTRMGEEGTCRRRENTFSHRITQDTSCMCTALRWGATYHVGPVDNSGAVPPAAQHFSLEHLGAVAAMIITNKHTNLRSNSCVWSSTGTRKRASQWKDGRSVAKIYGWWTMVENLKPFIMGALLDLLRCPSLWTSDDGISRSSSIFSWGITPELFMVWSCLRQDAKWGSVWGLHLHLCSSTLRAQLDMFWSETSGAERSGSSEQTTVSISGVCDPQHRKARSAEQLTLLARRLDVGWRPSTVTLLWLHHIS